MKKTIAKIGLTCLLLIFFAAPVLAATQGSLLLTKVEQPVMVFAVADAQGTPNWDFAVVVERLTTADLTQSVAKKLYQQAQDRELTGVRGTADEKEEIFFPNLEEGWYLVCSMGEQPEFAPFLICVPMTIGEKTVYDIQAEPKVDSPTDSTGPSGPMEITPNIPQTGAILWPKYLLLLLGAAAIAAGLIEVIRGREKGYE